MTPTKRLIDNLSKDNKIGVLFRVLIVQSIHDILQVSIAEHVDVIFLNAQSSFLLATTTEVIKTSLYVMVSSNGDPYSLPFSLSYMP